MQFGLCSMNGANYEIHDNPYLRNVKYFKSIIVHNVTTFNKYIFDNIRKINKEQDKETPECIDDNAYSKNVMLECLNKYPDYLSFRDLNPKNAFTTYYQDYMDLADPNYESKKDSCELHLIGTPEDIDDLLMFPDLIVIEVSESILLTYTIYFPFIIRDCNPKGNFVVSFVSSKKVVPIPSIFVFDTIFIFPFAFILPSSGR